MYQTLALFLQFIQFVISKEMDFKYGNDLKTFEVIQS